MILTPDTPGSKNIILFKDGKPLGCVVWADTGTRQYKQRWLGGKVETGTYDYLEVRTPKAPEN